MAVVESKSVTAAARRLGCSASTVSTQLTGLETAIGASLIIRSAQRFELTAAGSQFVDRARAILGEVEAAKADLAAQGHTKSMHLRIAVIEEFDRNVLPKWLRSVLQIYPDCTFDIRSGTSHESHAALFDHGVDIIVAADNTTFIEGIDEIQILNDPFVLLTVNADPANLQLSNLLKKPFVRYSSQQLLAQQIEAQLRRSRIRPEQSFECSTTQAVISMVQRFNGWAFTTASAALGTLPVHEIKDGGVCFAPLPVQPFSRTISLYYRSGTLGDTPEHIASALKETLSSAYLPAAKQQLPFVREQLNIFGHK